MIAPPELNLPRDYRLFLPRSDDTAGGEAAVLRVATVVADLYDLPADELLALAGDSHSVLAIQLQSKDYENGSLPFLSFEGMVEKLRRTLLHTAAFVITESPTVEDIPEEAQQYLARCRFLQTAIGSYVARVQLPESEPLLEPTLFTGGLPSSEVSAALAEALSFVTTKVFTDDRSIYTDEAMEEDASEINIDVFRDIGELLEKSGADSVNFTFTSAAGAQTLSSGRLSPQRFQRLESFVTFAQKRLAAEQDIEVIGRIVELRSRRPDRRRNHVGIAAILEGREVFIALTMGKQDYPYAVMAHNRNRKVRLRASVRRMKTQLRVVKLGTFEELDESAETGETAK